MTQNFEATEPNPSASPAGQHEVATPGYSDGDIEPVGPPPSMSVEPETHVDINGSDEVEHPSGP